MKLLAQFSVQLILVLMAFFGAAILPGAEGRAPDGTTVVVRWTTKQIGSDPGPVVAIGKSPVVQQQSSKLDFLKSRK